MEPKAPGPVSKPDTLLSGTVFSGTGRAAFFTQLEWVRSQCLTKLGFEPHPGTLNLLLAEPDRHFMSQIPSFPGVPLIPPDGSYCGSLVYPVTIETVPGAIILPEEGVRAHGADVIEVLAPIFLREALKVKDGDRVCLTLMAARKLNARAVLFDLDGTLIDSTGLYLKMVQIVLGRLGFPEVSKEDVMTAAEKDPFDWLMIIPKHFHPQRDTLIPAAWRIIEETYPALFREKVEMIDGAVDIIHRLVAGGIKIGIVTSTPRKHIQHKMQLFHQRDIAQLITALISADDAPRKKPAPDPLIACANLLGIPASDCIYVGDTRIDIRAGKAAGMKTIAVLSGFDSAEALAAEKPDAVIDNVGALNNVLAFFPAPAGG